MKSFVVNYKSLDFVDSKQIGTSVDLIWKNMQFRSLRRTLMYYIKKTGNVKNLDFVKALFRRLRAHF